VTVKTETEMGADIRSGDAKIDDLVLALARRLDELDAVVTRLGKHLPKRADGSMVL
jgi:hypothetical protein